MRDSSSLSARRLRVTHCPVNFAGVPWRNVQALRRKGVDARLVVFNRGKLHPEADVDLRRPDGFARGQLVQARALARLLPATDVFHFYFGLTLVPKKLQFPILKAARKKSVFHFLGSDIRRKTPAELSYGRRADAQIVGSFDAIRWVPEAHVVPPGIDLSRYRPLPPSDTDRPLVVHAASHRSRKGTETVIQACSQLGLELDVVENVPHEEATERFARADIVVDQLQSGWYGLFAIETMALGKPVVGYIRDEPRRLTERAFGAEVPIATTTKQRLVDTLRALAGDPVERRRRGEASRAYVERVHDADRIAERLIEIYRQL